MAICNYIQRGFASGGTERYDANQAYVCEMQVQEEIDLDAVNLHDPIEQRKQAIPEDGRGHWIVDGVVDVIGNTDEERLEAEGFWHARKVVSLTVSCLTGALAAGTIVTAFFVSNPWLLALTIAAAIALVFFTVVCCCTCSEASWQEGYWGENPADRVARERTAACQAGYTYVFRNKLKGDILHPREVANLHMQNLESLFNRIDILQDADMQTKARLSEDFINDNPLEPERLEYALGLDHTLNPFSQDFSWLQSDVRQLQASSSEKFNEAYAEKQAALQEINEELELALAPSHAMIDQLKRNARAERDRLVYPLSGDDLHELIHDIEQSYQRKLAEYDAAFRTQSALIRAPFDRHIAEVERRYNQKCGQLQSEKDTSLQPQFDRAKDLIARAHKSVFMEALQTVLTRDTAGIVASYLFRYNVTITQAPPGGPAL